MWKHDLYNGPGKSLSSRLADPGPGGNAPRVDTSGAAQALRVAVGLQSTRSTGGNLNIKGASAANVVEVAKLAKGTTAADVEVRNGKFSCSDEG